MSIITSPDSKEVCDMGDLCHVDEHAKALRWEAPQLFSVMYSISRPLSFSLQVDELLKKNRIPNQRALPPATHHPPRVRSCISA